MRRTTDQVPGKLPPGTPVAVALSGGGTKLYAHLGVLQAVEDSGLVIKRITGVSAGALVAAAWVCLGGRGAHQGVAAFDVARCFRWGWGRGWSLFDNAAVADAARELDITWLRAAASGIDLEIVAGALEPGVPLVWSKDRRPFGYSLAECVRMSSSIPLLWPCTTMPADTSGLDPATVRRAPATITVVDGGCVDMLLDVGPSLPLICSNLAFNGARSSVVQGFTDYLAQLLSVMQYQAIRPTLARAAAVVKHDHLASAGWLDIPDRAAVEAMIQAAYWETRGILA